MANDPGDQQVQSAEELLTLLIDDHLWRHPWPWAVDWDWTWEIYDAKQQLVVKCGTAAHATALIELAEARHKIHLTRAEEVEALMVAAELEISGE